MIVRKSLAEELHWFPQARYGLFIHFGLYALLERGEWVMYRESIPRETYERLQKRFNPRRFQAEEWVQAALDCGCRYMTVTAKHHDGFCLFDSALTDFKITNTPFGRDLIGELAAACQQAKLPLILYYSQPDWHHPNFVHRPGAFKDLPTQPPEDEPNWERYLDYYVGQVEELCTRYGRIGGFWFDGVQRTAAQWRGRKVYELIKRHQPQAVVNDRAGYGDFFTPERSLAEACAAAGYMVEACQSVATSAWGYRRGAALYQTPELLRNLLRMVAAGGNYLLNVGPRADGTLPEKWLARMREMGEWLRRHEAAVYGAEGCPGQALGPDQVFTRRGRRVYLHLLQWPATDEMVLPNLVAMPREARLMGTRRKLRRNCREGQVVLSGLPASPPSALANVVALTFDTERVFRPKSRPPRPATREVKPGATARLKPEAAQRRGFGIKGAELALIPRNKGGDLFSPNWTPEQSATWRLTSVAGGRYQVRVVLACPKHHQGSEFEVRVNRQRRRATVPLTGGARRFQAVELGEISLPAGSSRLVLRPRKMHYAYYFAVVREVVLKPVATTSSGNREKRS